MAQPLSIENDHDVYFITTRTAGSRLWLIRNPKLEHRILGILAKYQNTYRVRIYGFILMGNHYHLIASFPHRNMAKFMRDFNSSVARMVGRSVKRHGRRSVWARRYSYQVLPRADDVKHWFFYLVLNPTISGLCKNPLEYQSYNSFHDAVTGTCRSYKWIDWSAFLLASRGNTQLTPDDFATEYQLIYSRLPGFEETPARDYTNMMKEDLESRRQSCIKERFDAGKGFLGPAILRKQVIGSIPYSTKTSHRYSFRPLVLTLCTQAKSDFLKKYFGIVSLFKEASELFRAGIYSTVFPSGTYPPPILHAAL